MLLICKLCKELLLGRDHVFFKSMNSVYASSKTSLALHKDSLSGHNWERILYRNR